MGPETLAQVLRPLANMFLPEDHPNLMVGLAVSDDAAVYRINDDVAVILTVDFFTPVVDNPYDYGAIAAANAISDIYAMGGEVVLALNVCGFPPDLDPAITIEILRGGAEKLKEAGGALVGGHTVDDKEPKYGMAVMGLVHPQRVWTKAGARPGDVLVLTKPLGVGIITTAFKGGVSKPGHIETVTESMQHLSRDAMRLLQKVGIRGCTDVTGFALLGHALELAQKSGVRLRLDFNRLPFHPGAKVYAHDWLFPAGACSNQKYFQDDIDFDAGLAEEMRMLLFTPETSGGLLAAVPAEDVERMQELFSQAGERYWIIGEVLAGEGIEVAL